MLITAVGVTGVAVKIAVDVVDDGCKRLDVVVVVADCLFDFDIDCLVHGKCCYYHY